MTTRTALVLGGTQFVGRHLVQELLDTGWEVSIFSRGRTNPELIPQVHRLVGDRRSDVSALAGGRWDVVFDVSAYHPDDVARVADASATVAGITFSSPACPPTPTSPPSASPRTLP